uniref:Uncharacterized protein n=1 Tax=Arundo donax TaxID=35708 RepID=A0A0A9FWD8_ARUDO
MLQESTVLFPEFRGIYGQLNLHVLIVTNFPWLNLSIYTTFRERDKAE